MERGSQNPLAIGLFGLAICALILGAVSILLWEPLLGYVLIAAGAALLIAANALHGRPRVYR